MLAAFKNPLKFAEVAIQFLFEVEVECCAGLVDIEN
jgi:hypothetical protein